MGWSWSLGAAFLGFVIPFTVAVIKPTNDRLKDPALDPSSADAARLLARWSRLHALRSLAGVLSLLIFVRALARSVMRIAPDIAVLDARRRLRA